ncbi:hypothetical protein LSTR_LSTR000575 [Laodelphax striatellus]|uniref:CHHC U11-48K-type domain-containing protein n=1 Tax=Laodelphax striatellus TaxID=195883 RepID=A0A482XFR5_LAOST|nr:hypothetical protein LSTR_LSTR000575 [Laodelphax striatellus]
MSSAAYVRELDRRFKICPFDENHLIERTRFHSHLIKCKKNHEKSNLVMCPYDGSEYIAPEMMAQHLLVCKKKDLMLMPTESIRDRNLDMDRSLRKIHVTSTEDEKDWDLDDDYMSKDHKDVKESLNKIEETKRSMQPFYENAYGAVLTVGRGSALSHLGALPVSGGRTLALSPSIPKTRGRVPGIEEKKYDEFNVEEKLDDEGNYDDAEVEEDDDDDDDDDDEDSSVDNESFWNHYTDINLPSQQQNQDKVKGVRNSLPSTPSRGQEEEKNISSDAKKDLYDTALANKIVARRGFGRGFSRFLENPPKYEEETKPTTLEVEEDKGKFSYDNIDKMLENISFRPSKASQNGYSTEEEKEDLETASSLSQSVSSTESRSPPRRSQNVSKTNFKSGLPPCLLRRMNQN